MTDRFSLLEELCNTPGVVGNEAQIAKIVADRLSPVCEKIEKDRIGCVICRHTGDDQGPRVMLISHMDEVGYMVDHIYPDGYIGYHCVGGWDPCQQLGMRILIHTVEGDIPGVIAIKNRTSDDWKKTLEPNDLFIDIGTFSAEEARGFGVRIGDFISADYQLRRLRNEKMLMSKAFDCRAGVGVMVESVLSLATTHHPNILFGVGSVQEEVGCRGARTAAVKVKPDICIALDTGDAGDLFGSPLNSPDRGLGKGPNIIVMDRAMIAHLKLRQWVIDLAEDLQIPHQVIYLNGGSFDSSVVHFSDIGVPSLAIAIPSRYVHTVGTIINWDDYESTIRLVTSIVSRLDSKTFEGLLA